ncbi:MAG TPA: hypothetical protein VHJ20_15235 [Polyangia bacterium]|nr:hypothetical protein [Polyangia bacterium]
MLSISSRARAEDPETLIKQGVELRRQGLDSRAEGYFRRAHEIAHTPRTAAQLGLVELAVGEFLEADGHLSEALGSHDAWVNEHRKTLESSRTQARKHLVRVKLTGAPKGTTVTSDAGEAVPLPSDATLSLAAGTTSLHLDAPDHKSASLNVTGAAGDTREMSVDMPSLLATPAAPVAVAVTPVVPPPTATPAAESATPAAEPNPAPEAPSSSTPGRGLRISGLVVGGVGVVADAVGVVLLTQGNSKAADINSSKTYDSGKDGNYKTLQQAGVGLLVGGSAALVGGAALFLIGRHEGHAQQEGSVAFVPGPGFGVLSYGRTF